MTKEEALPSTRKHSSATARPSMTEKLTMPTGRTLRLNRVGHLLTVTWAILAAIATASNIYLVQLMERQAQLMFFELRGPLPAPEDVVVLAIDEQSLGQEQTYRSDPQKYAYLEPIQAWPWKRTAYAEVIERIMAAGARAVAVDVIFSRPSSYGPEDDQRLRQTLDRYPGRVTLAAQYEDIAERGGGTTQLTSPHPRFRTKSLSVGWINFWVEPDGKIYRLGNQFPSLLAQQYPDQAGAISQLNDGIHAFAQATVEATQLAFPKPEGQHIFFYGPAGTFDQIPFWSVLDPNNWNTQFEKGKFFKNKIVLIGATAISLQDFHAAPFSKTWSYPEPMAGVEIHANSIATLLEGRSIREALPNLSLRAALILLGVLGVGFVLSRPKRPLNRLLLAVGVAIAWGGVSYLTFSYQFLLLPTAVPVTAIMLSGFSYLLVGSTTEHLKKLQLRRTLKYYASSPIVQEIISQQDDLHDLLQQREQALVGTKLAGRYTITKVLGSGGFSETYIAEDTQRPGNPSCVVKQLRPASDNLKLLQLARRLFHQEAETLEKLGKHNQIPQLLAYFEDNQEFYLVQEYIQGIPLNRELTLGKQLPEARVIEFLHDILKILEFVHSHGVIHRDIKPSNMIRRQSDAKLVLIDFGAVKEIQTLAEEQDPAQVPLTIGIGTQGYMPNEQCAGSPRLNSDIYAVGMTAIQALTGLPPHQLQKDPQTEEILWRHRAQVSHELAAVISKMVRYDFTQRYQSATQVLNALKELRLQQPAGLPTIVDLLPTVITDATEADDVTQTAPLEEEDSLAETSALRTEPASTMASTVAWPDNFSGDRGSAADDPTEV